MSFAYFLQGVSLTLLGLILYRACTNRMLGHFPIFYGYIGYVFIGIPFLILTLGVCRAYLI